MTIVSQQKPWQEIARQVQAARERSIEQVDPDIAALPETHAGRVIDVARNYLSPSEQAISESSAQTLVASLAAGKLTALAVTNVFLRRAAIAQKLVNPKSSPKILSSSFQSNSIVFYPDKLYLRTPARTRPSPSQAAR